MRGPLSTRFQDADRTPLDTVEVSWYGDRLPPAPTLCLQAMCGIGRLLLPLLAAGVRVQGVDVSGSRLDRCRTRLAAEGLDTTLFRQDVCRLNLPLRYGAAVIADSGFQWLADEHSARDALRRLRAHLVEPGVLLLDLVVPDIAERRPGAPVVEVRRRTLDDGSDIAVRSETTVDPDARLVTFSSRYEQRVGPACTGRENETLRMTWYQEDEIERLLADSGYVDIGFEPAPAGATPGRRFAVRALAH
jgi:hypothetical protein